MFAILGISCAIFAIRSCRWFVLSVKDDNTVYQFTTDKHEQHLNPNSTINIGLFRYETSNLLFIEHVQQNGSDINSSNGNNNITIHDDDDDDSNNDDDVHQCEPYPRFWIGLDYKWKFTAQICVMVGPIIAFQSLCFTIVGAKRFWICTFLLLAMGLQAGTVISSLSYCDRYWHCPWLLGAKVNLIAACSFLLGWLCALFGVVEDENDTINNHNHNSDNYKSRNKIKNEERNIEDAQQEFWSDSSPAIISNDCYGDEIEFSCTSSTISDNINVDPYQGDIEKGSNIYDNLSLREDDGVAIRDKEATQNDENDTSDVESKSKKTSDAKRSISRCDQIFLDLGPKLDQRRRKIECTIIKGQTDKS